MDSTSISEILTQENVLSGAIQTMEEITPYADVDHSTNGTINKDSNTVETREYTEYVITAERNSK